MATRYPITHTSITVPTAAGTTLLTAADAAAQRTALGVPRAVTLYAADGTAESGSATASLSGSGSSSTFTLSTTSQTVAYTTSATTAPRILLTIPANAVSINLEMKLSSVSGFTNTNSICLVAALRPTGGGTPARLWGLSWVDTFGAAQVLIGNLSTAANGGAGLGSLSTAFFGNGNPETDRWMRASWSPLQPWLGASFGKAASAGARPAYWLVPSTQVTSPTSAVEIVDSTLETQIAVYISTLSNRTCSVTGTLTARALVL